MPPEFLTAIRNPHLIDRELASRSLTEFIQQGWRYVDPSPYVHGWHIDAIAEHLEAVNAGQVQRLIINIPPRCMKSISVAVAWPAWTWQLEASTSLSGPGTRFLYASYAQSLSIRDNLKCRRLIESPWYQQNWGGGFRLTSDQNTKIRFDNDQGGYRLATSVDGALTGEGGDIIVVDDAHNVTEAESDAERSNVIAWWDQAMSTRLNDPKTGAYVIIMQRVHEVDLVGHILAREHGWDHLCLPAEYEPNHIFPVRSSLGYEDPRTRKGELLWPERFGPGEVEELKSRLGPSASGQLQQRPSPEEGDYFKRDWINWYEQAPKHVRHYGASDYAVTANGGDYTVHGVIGVDPDDDIYILDWWRDQTASDEWIEVLLDLMKQWQPLAWGEEKGQILKSLGPFIDKRMRERKIYGYRHQYSSAADKPTRAQAIRGRMAMGKVYLPRNAPWAEALVDELLKFPNGRNDDQVDVLSLFGRMLTGMLSGKVPEKKPKEIDTRLPTYDELIEAGKYREIRRL